jgi:hydrogenase maturation factor HypF (carbamoyltransferase family)
MARSVSVKIPTSVVVEMIETKLAEITKAETDYPKLLSAYKKDIVAFTGELLDLANKNKKNVVDYGDYEFEGGNIAINSDWRGSVSIALGKDLVAKIGTKPEKPEDPNTWQTKEKKKNLEKTLKLLRLTDQETITSSTYNSVLDLL